MDRIKNAFLSKRVWVIIVMFLINGFSGISNELPPEVMQIINPILLVLGIMFGAKK